MVGTTSDRVDVAQGEDKIRGWIAKSIITKNSIYINRDLVRQIYKLAEILTSTIASGNKVMACGSGGSSSQAAHFVGELLNQFCMGRTKPLAGIDLSAMSATMTAISNDWGYDYVFLKQMEGLGKPGDLLIGISTSGNSENILHAIHRAKYLDIKSALLTGGSTGPFLIERRACGQRIDPIIVEPDYLINVPSDHTPIIQESHIMILHILVYMLDWLRTGVDYFDKETW